MGNLSGLLIVVAVILLIRHAVRVGPTCVACGMPRTAARRIIERPDLRLCETCVATGLHRLADRQQTAPTDQGVTEVPVLTRCHYCGTAASTACPVVAIPESRICQACLFICQGLLREVEPARYGETARRMQRDRVIEAIFWVVGTGVWLILLAPDCFRR
jgi:ATP-dependent protease Clp ATPase subunit